MAGFANINVDLMSGIPGQTLESWRNTLKKVTMLKPEHISAYSLIIEPGTPFWDRYGAGIEKTAAKSAPQPGTCPGEAPDRFGLRRRDYPELPDEEEENRIYHLTRTFLAEQGYERYEISNYARPGFACRHNVGYWTEVEYLGLGLGASSFLGGCRFCNERDLERYLGLDFAAEGWAAAPAPAIYPPEPGGADGGIHVSGAADDPRYLRDRFCGDLRGQAGLGVRPGD